MTITVVNTLGQGSSNGNGFTSSAVDCSGANFLAVATNVDPTTDVITDSQSNTWAYYAGPTSFAGKYAAIWYAVNPSVSSTQTFSISGSGHNPSIAVVALAGADTSTPIDQVSAGDSNLFSGTIQPGSVTPGSDNEIVIAAIGGIADNGANESINGGFTIAGQVAQVNSQCDIVALAYLIQTTATAANPTFTASSGGLTFSAKSITVKAAAGGGTTVGITGVAGTGAVGNIASSISAGLTGVSATSAVGTIAASSSKALTGNAAPGQVGSVVSSFTKALTGNAGTGQVGTVTPSTGFVVALTGVQATGAVGSVSPAVVKPLTGNAATGAVGTIAAGSSKGITGNAATGQIGSLAASFLIALNGVQCTGQVGNVAVVTNVTLQLTGVQGVGQVGTVTAVSSGGNSFIVANYVGMFIQQAGFLAYRAGFDEVQVAQQRTGGIPVGTVLSQLPAAGVAVPRGSDITFTIVMGNVPGFTYDFSSPYT